MICSTYTYAVLAVSHAAYTEIKAKLEAAGYQHAFHEDRDDGIVIDMHGIALSNEEKGTHGDRSSRRRGSQEDGDPQA